MLLNLPPTLILTIFIGEQIAIKYFVASYTLILLCSLIITCFRMLTWVTMYFFSGPGTYPEWRNTGVRINLGFVSEETGQ